MLMALQRPRLSSHHHTPQPVSRAETYYVKEVTGGVPPRAFNTEQPCNEMLFSFSIKVVLQNNELG
jgi:hypothetical protein